ncbi:MAG: hypothetical protein PVH87_24120 [Desulfobacteraceae bacterium]
MRKTSLFFSALLLAVFIINLQSAYSGQANQCRDNFTVEEDRYGTKTYKTIGFFDSANADSAYDRVHQYILEEGLHINYSNKKTGSISALQPVSHSKKMAPLNVVIQKVKYNKYKVIVTFVTAGGLVSRPNDVVDFFCEIIKTADGNYLNR